MDKRLYFSDPIQALYMMKEFNVKLECKNSDEEIQEYDLKDDDMFYPFDESSLNQPDRIDDLIAEFDNFRKIYVTKESELIFEPKIDDLGLDQDNIPNTCQYYDDGWYIKDSHDYKNGVRIKGDVKIIISDGKHFFSAEVET